MPAPSLLPSMIKSIIISYRSLCGASIFTTEPSPDTTATRTPSFSHSTKCNSPQLVTSIGQDKTTDWLRNFDIVLSGRNNGRNQIKNQRKRQKRNGIWKSTFRRWVKKLERALTHTSKRPDGHAHSKRDKVIKWSGMNMEANWMHTAFLFNAKYSLWIQRDDL